MDHLADFDLVEQREVGMVGRHRPLALLLVLAQILLALALVALALVFFIRVLRAPGAVCVGVRSVQYGQECAVSE